MAAFELLASRIKGEYREMPGLRLTLPQACRLWHIDPAVCEQVLDSLMREGVLHRTHEGAYVALPAPAGEYARAALHAIVLPRRRA